MPSEPIHPDQMSAEDREFCVDTLDFFQRRRAGHLSRWLYSSPKFPGDKACGSVVRERVIQEAKNGSAYRVFNQEVSIIKKSAGAIAALIDGPARVADLGPGTLDAVREKLFPILNSSKLITDYVGVDVNTTTLNNAVAAVRDELKIKSSPVHHDFIHDDFEYGPHIAIDIATMFGQTAFNMEIDPEIKDLPQQALADYLSRIRSHFNGDAKYLIITQDVNQDPETLVAAHFAISDYFRCLPYRMQRDLPISGDFNPDDFDLDVHHFSETYAVSICLIPKRAMTFAINGETCRLEKGERFYFHNSYKFIREILIDAAKKSGFECVKTIAEDGNLCILHILKAI